LTLAANSGKRIRGAGIPRMRPDGPGSSKGSALTQSIRLERL
jgi:hypothetical protein